MDNFLEQAYQRIRQAAVVTAQAPASTLPAQEKLSEARASLPDPAAADYLSSHGPEATLDHLMGATTGGLNGNFKLTPSTVADDADADSLSGNDSLD